MNFDDLSGRQKRSACEALTIWFWVKRVVSFVLLITLLILGGCPNYNVWEQGLKGEAELKRAEQNRKIIVQDSLAKKESSQNLADSEAIRATGIKIANETIAEGLGGAEGYLRYLYIDALKETSCSIIYVPTEAGLPILEASRNINMNKGK